MYALYGSDALVSSDTLLSIYEDCCLIILQIFFVCGRFVLEHKHVATVNVLSMLMILYGKKAQQHNSSSRL